MRLEELFQLVLELREGGSDDQKIAPSDAKKSSQDTAKLLQDGVDYAFLIVVLAGLAVGLSSVAALTAGDGTKPINVLYLVSVTMLLPLFGTLLTLVLALRMLRGKSMRGPLVDLAMSVLRGGVWVASRALDRSEKATQLRIKAALGVFRGDYEMMQPVVPWLTRRIVQTFSLALSVGFVLALMIRLTGIDLTFGWQSTGDFLLSILPQATELLSAPFGWLSPDFKPSAELINDTRFSRFTGDYVGGPSAAPLSWQWVPFLIAGAVFWGIVPRVFLLLWFGERQKSAIVRVNEEWDPVRQLQARLGDVEIDRPAPEDHPFAPDTLKEDAKEAAREGRAGTALGRKSAPKEGAPVEAALLIWENDVPPPPAVLAALSQRLNAKIVTQRPYGVRPADDEATLADLKARATKLVLLHVEPFSPPGAGFVRQFRALREAVGAHTPIVIELGWWENGVRQALPPRTFEVWQQSIQKLSDRGIRWHLSDDGAENTRANENALSASDGDSR